MTVSAIPKGFSSVTPYLIIEGAQQAICFYRDAFNAVSNANAAARGRYSPC